MAFAHASAHEFDDGALHGVLGGGVVGDGVALGLGGAVFRRHVGAAADVHGEGEAGFFGQRPDGFVALVEVGTAGGGGAGDAAAAEAELDDAGEFLGCGGGVLDRDCGQAVEATFGGGGVVVQPVVVVLLQGDEEIGVGKAEHGEEAGVEELGGEAVHVLVFVAVGAVHESFAHSGVAAVEERHEFRVFHVRHVGLVAGLAAERFVAGEARGGHAHAGHAHASHAAFGHDDGIDLIAHVHDARGGVAEAVGEAREHVATFHDVRIRGNRLHGTPKIVPSQKPNPISLLAALVVSPHRHLQRGGWPAA